MILQVKNIQGHFYKTGQHQPAAPQFVPRFEVVADKTSQDVLDALKCDSCQEGILILTNLQYINSS